MTRLVLFDIDGTLINTGGAGSRSVREALLQVYGRTGPIDSYDFHGRTDPQIVRELMRRAGLDDNRIDRRIDELWAVYLARLEAELERAERAPEVLPGVTEILDALHEQQDDLVALLTGNIEEGAALKLGAANLWHRFDFGAYGSDHERRDRLPAIAVERARQATGLEFSGRNVVIIGDTPFDVHCGREMGVWAVAVATGKHSPAELEAAGADVVLESLVDTRRVLEAIAAGSTVADRGP